MIFVFGSNLAGRHGKGAAKWAKENKGAKYGVGEGRTGNSYALPTKDENIKTRPLEDIEESVKKFLSYATEEKEEAFLVTPVGCGLAGYKPYQIRALFMKYNIPNNVFFSREWFQPYKETKVYK